MEIVSCIITTHNRRDLLPRAMRSALAQTYKKLDIIIIDDASDDNTEQVAQQFIKNDKRVRYIRNDFQIGPGASRNLGVSCAKGAYVSFLDDDDVWVECKIERQSQTIRNFDASMCAMTARSGRPMRPYPREIVEANDLKKGNMLGSTSCLMARTSIMKETHFDNSLRDRKSVV